MTAIWAVVSTFIIVLLLHQSAKEREKLYNRLQAGSLPEYASYKSLVEPERERKHPVEDEPEIVEDVDEGIAETAMAQAQATFNSL
jgi:hypothetical protein